MYTIGEKSERETLGGGNSALLEHLVVEHPVGRDFGENHRQRQFDVGRDGPAPRGLVEHERHFFGGGDLVGGGLGLLDGNGDTGAHLEHLGLGGLVLRDDLGLARRKHLGSRRRRAGEHRCSLDRPALVDGAGEVLSEGGVRVHFRRVGFVLGLSRP